MNPTESKKASERLNLTPYPAYQKKETPKAQMNDASAQSRSVSHAAPNVVSIAGTLLPVCESPR